MKLRTRRIVRMELTVADLVRAERFYVDGLGFVAGRRGDVDPAVMGAGRVAAVELHRGGQTLVLQAFQPPGAPYPDGSMSSDQVFQHFAIPVTDMNQSHGRLMAVGPTLISPAPQLLPARSGGVVAFKFRDPDGHPLELIEFPDRHDDGIDHSAIVVADVDRSIAFYREQLGFDVASRQVNTGAEQDRLDGLSDVTVDVVAMTPGQSTPHLELLGYRNPVVRPTSLWRPQDIAATRLVLEVEALPNGERPMLIHDPDGHALLLEPSRTS